MFTDDGPTYAKLFYDPDFDAEEAKQAFQMLRQAGYIVYALPVDYSGPELCIHRIPKIITGLDRVRQFIEEDRECMEKIRAEMCNIVKKGTCPGCKPLEVRYFLS